MAPPTILTHKSAFLTAQTLQLSRNLAPSRGWRTSNDRSEHAVTERALDEALYRLNHTLQQHVRRVYPQQATRHVAEQIEGLFLDAGEPAAAEESEGEGAGGQRFYTRERWSVRAAGVTVCGPGDAIAPTRPSS